jgi:hypothetical protein
MSPRALLTSLAVGRLAIGAALTAKPASQAGAGWIGAEEAQRPAAGLLFRSVGARDMALALGTLGAMREGGRLRPWLLAATLADVVDLAATFAAGKTIPAKGRATIALFAGGAIAGQLALTRQLD